MAKPRIDWDAIERDYRTEKFTDGELAAKYGVARESIPRRRKREQAKDPTRWARDITPQVRAATNALLASQVVTAAVTEGHTAITDVILASAELNKQVILAQRGRVTKATDVAMRMLAELDATTTHGKELAGLIETISHAATEEQIEEMRASMGKLLALHNRVGSAHKLMDAIGKAQALERVAFNIEEGGPERDPAREMSDVERAARLATLLARARAAKDSA